MHSRRSDCSTFPADALIVAGPNAAECRPGAADDRNGATSGATAVAAALSSLQDLGAESDQVAAAEGDAHDSASLSPPTPPEPERRQSPLPSPPVSVAAAADVRSSGSTTAGDTAGSDGSGAPRGKTGLNAHAATPAPRLQRAKAWQVPFEFDRVHHTIVFVSLLTRGAISSRIRQGTPNTLIFVSLPAMGTVSFTSEPKSSCKTLLNVGV